MTSADIVDLYSRIGVNAEVKVVQEPINELPIGVKYRRLVKAEKEQSDTGAEKNA